MEGSRAEMDEEKSRWEEHIDWIDKDKRGCIGR